MQESNARVNDCSVTDSGQGIEIRIVLTTSQVEELRQGRPVTVVLPEVGTECVLIRRDVYDSLTQTLEADEGFDACEAYALINDVMAEDDANDPWIESYQH